MCSNFYVWLKNAILISINLLNNAYCDIVTSSDYLNYKKLCRIQNGVFSVEKLSSSQIPWHAKFYECTQSLNESNTE